MKEYLATGAENQTFNLMTGSGEDIQIPFRRDSYYTLK